MEIIEIVGLIAAALTTGAYIPQVYKALKEKSTTDVSLTMYAILFIGIVLWFVYGVYHESLAIILANGITGILVIFMIFLKIKHK